MSDLISRTDALEAFKDMPMTYDAETVQRCIEAVSNLPTIEAEPVRHAKLLNAYPYGECSNCGYLIDIREEFKYCPNCGARMDKE